MTKPRIILPNGFPLDMDKSNVRPTIFGYRIEHKLTGRILPGTNRDEIYSKTAGIRKMNKIASAYQQVGEHFNIWDYILVAVYDFEKPDKYVYIVDDMDNFNNDDLNY